MQWMLLLELLESQTAMASALPSTLFATHETQELVQDTLREHFVLQRSQALLRLPAKPFGREPQGFVIQILEQCYFHYRQRRSKL